MKILTWTPPDPSHQTEYRAFNAQWQKSLDNLRTNKWKLFDFGTGLIAISFSSLATLLILRIKFLVDFANLKTPKSRMAILAICTLAWFGLFASEAYSLFQDLRRHEFPVWADSLGIPLAGLFVAGIIGWVVLAGLTWILVLRGALLPADIWIWRRDRPIASSILTACAASSLILTLNLMYAAISRGPFLEIPAIFAWVYATLVVRSAGISQISI